MAMAEIILPAMNDEENQKIIDAVEAIGKCMDTDITIEKIFIVKITFSSMRGDVRAILTDLVESKTKRKTTRGKDIKLGNPSDDFIDPKNL
jgi:hypothetical protein